jgi:hypothetical protein
MCQENCFCEKSVGCFWKKKINKSRYGCYWIHEVISRAEKTWNILGRSYSQVILHESLNYSLHFRDPKMIIRIETWWVWLMQEKGWKPSLKTTVEGRRSVQKYILVYLDLIAFSKSVSVLVVASWFMWLFKVSDPAPSGGCLGGTCGWSSANQSSQVSRWLFLSLFMEIKSHPSTGSQSMPPKY